MTDPHDRDAILARRALFISAALAGLACTTHEGPKHGSDSGNDGGNDSGPVAPADRTEWDAIMAKAPALDLPKSGISPTERDHLRGVGDTYGPRYEHLREIWDTVPRCAPDKAGCEAWKQMVAALKAAEPPGPPLCGDPGSWTGTVSGRASAHDQYIEKLRRELLTELDELAARYEGSGEQAWKGLRATVNHTPPNVCLSCAMPAPYPMYAAIPFAAGDATLTPETRGVGSELDDALRAAQRNEGDKLIVRGHADADEPEPEALGLRRAKAVADWLVAQGVRAESIETRSLAANLPIARDPAKAQLNRRVDFEVVP